ncbi:Hypothetical protein Minf_1106 [Methylacidiphilum infernorum V4]|uniref:Uncharacterized protein n=1 Tax=Methylacidiphilum infernorum (isolate V4) TaxID=481448 RepID=B3DV08_METI4|nr:Hypothetical protein Minf_1106 [Methylacidiphilum infernorum V4]
MTLKELQGFNERGNPGRQIKKIEKKNSFFLN